MSKRWLWLTIAAVAVAFAAGWGVAQEDQEYPYLPAEYSEAYIPTMAEWREMEFNAFWNCEGPLTDRLKTISCRVLAMAGGVVVYVDTKTRPEWDMCEGNGDFSCPAEEVRATYAAAAEGLARSVRINFEEIADENVQIRFSIHGHNVGVWQGGEMTLAGEE